jgi:hypothetical protein
MQPATREAMLAEQAADWDAMSRDPGQATNRRMISRQFRGIPAAVWWRLARGETTTIPAGVAVILLTAAVIVDSATVGYPVAQRISEFVGAIGLAATAWYLMRQPRRIEIARFRPAFALVSIGSVGSMLTFDGSGDPVNPDVVTGPLLGYTMEFGIFLAGAGYVALFVASLVKRRRAVALVGGTLVVAGTLIVAATEVVWGVLCLRADIFVAIIAFLVAFGAALFSHMVFRLRKLEIT